MLGAPSPRSRVIAAALVRRRHHSRCASASTCAAAPRSCSRPGTPPTVKARRGVHRPRPRGAAPAGRRARRRRADPGPLRRAPRIIVELPGVQDPREAAEVIGRTAQLTFHPVLGSGDPAAAGDRRRRPAPAGAVEADPRRRGRASRCARPGRAHRRPRSTTPTPRSTPSGAAAGSSPLDFTGDGRAGAGSSSPATPPARRRATRRAGSRSSSTTQVISSPQVDPSIGCDVGIGGGSTQITGSFTDDEASDLAALIRGGALPVPVEVVEQRTVGPTLGDAAIDASAPRRVIGLALTALFIIVVYRLVGVARDARAGLLRAHLVRASWSASAPR